MNNLALSRFYPMYFYKLDPNFIVIICIWIRSWDEFDTKSGLKNLDRPFCTIWLIVIFQKSSDINHSFQIINSNFVLIQNKVVINDGNSWKMLIQSNLALRNCLIRNKLVLRNHFPWPICHLLHKDKELLSFRNNFRATKKFLIDKLDCTTERSPTTRLDI